MLWKPRTLRARLFLAAIAVEIAALAVIIPNSTRLVERTAAELTARRIDETVPLLVEALARPLLTRDVVTLERIISRIVEPRGLIEVQVFDESGRLMAAAKAGSVPGDLAGPIAQEQLESAVMLADRRVGSVRVAVSNAVISEAKRQAIWEGLIVGTLEIAVSVIALGLIALFLTRNLARLHAAAGAIAGGNPSVRAQVSGEDEVAQAARAFNQMLDRLQEARLLATQSETQYRNLVEHSQQAILVLEGERPVFANPACARLLGYPGPEPVLALATIADRVAPADRERLRAAMATGAGDARHHELEIVTADGRTRWLDCLPSAVQWRGRPALQLAMSDIGERKQAQLGLQESEGYFRTVAEAAPSALYVVERDSGRLRFANARVAEMFGFADSPLNHLMEEFYWDPSERPAVLRRIAAAGRVTDLQLRFRRRGEPFWGLVSSFAGTFQGVPALFSSVQDITERVHAEQALAASEGRYRSLVELIPEAILVHSEGVIRYANHTAVQTLGAQEASQLVGTRVLDCVHPEYRTRVQARIGRLAGGTGTVPMVQERLLRIDGAEFDAEVTAMGLAFEEQPSVLVVFRDITERLQAERALREAQQRLHTVIQYAPLILYVLDAEGRFLISEGRELAAVGRVPGEVVGQSAFDVFAHLPERVRALERALAGEALTEEVIVDGVHFDAYHQPLFDAQGAVSGLIVVSVNTTSRRQAEDALRASEARFRDFAHASSDWLWETDAEHRLSYLSDEFERITGERRENYIGKRREELSGDMDDADKWGEYRRLIEQRLPLRDFIYNAGRAGGEDLFLRINGTPVYDATGTFKGYRGTATNVTEQVRTQAALREIEARFRHLVEGSLQGVLMLDAEWKVLFANQAAADIYGYASPQELVALPSASALVAEADRERLGEYNRARLGGEVRPALYEHRGLRQDGREIQLQTFVRAVDWGGARCVQSTLVDVTDQKAAEEELRRSEAKFRRLFEETDLATFVFDKQWRPAFLNDSAARLFGYASREEALRLIKSGAELVYEEDRERLRAYRNERLAGRPVPSRYEFRAVRRDGQMLWLQNIVSIVEWEGRTATMTVALDVTAYKLREEELRQAQKMEVVGQLTGGVAHDFNNLLTVVMGNLELLRRRIGDDARLAALLESATSAAERGATLIQRLLAFSRKQALKPMAVDVNRLVTGMTELLRRTLGETIDVETVLTGGVWPALVDPNQLENTLLNLAINARDAMPGGGKLTIETGNARLDDDYAALHEEVTPGQYVLMAASDTGEGMSSDVLERAFEPFFTTKEVGRGSGLGLSMIYGFVKQSGGHVKIYSEPGQGTTVKVYLPRAPAAPGRHDRPGAVLTAPQGIQQKILVVEDDEPVRELARAILANLGYVPVVAEGGPAALHLLEEHPDVALLFTDVVLAGGMSGVELVREALRRRPGLKVLYMSGYTENAIIHHGRLDEGVELLEKPFRIESLARKVRAVLEDA